MERRGAAPDPDDLHVLNPTQTLHNIGQCRCRQRQRIAAGQKHVCNLRMPGDVGHRRRNVTKVFPLGTDEHTFSEAVPADTLADVADQQQNG